MALITTFKRGKRDKLNLHKTEIPATVYFQDKDGRKLLQIDTLGSKDREMPDKVSQTIQLDENAARELFGILKKEFRFQ